MQRIPLFVAVLVASLLVSCGGGGGGGSGPALAGKILSRNGSAAQLSGVFVECPETGSSDVSGATGVFSLDVPTGTTFRLRVEDPETGPVAGGPDCSEDEDDGEDAHDIRGDEVEIEALADGEDLDVEIEIEDGQIVGIRLTKHDDEDGEHEDEGESALLPPGGGEAYGEMEGGAREICSWLELEVAGLAPHAGYEVFLTMGAETVSLDGFETNAEGEAHRAWESCGGDRPLPFGVLSVRDLAGATVTIRDGEGNVVLEGLVPAVGSEDHDDEAEHEDEGDDDPEDGDDGEDGEDHEDGEEHEGGEHD